MEQRLRQRGRTCLIAVPCRLSALRCYPCLTRYQRHAALVGGYALSDAEEGTMDLPIGTAVRVWDDDRG
jgi:hypothetical protein